MSDTSTNGVALEHSGKPFPWRCPRCRQKAVRRVAIPYECTRKHNGESMRVEIAALTVPQCASCGELVFDYESEQQINDALLRLIDTHREPISG